MKYLPMKEDCLEWTVNFEKHSHLIENHIGRVANLLQNILDDQDLISKEIRESYSELPIESKINIIASPNVCEILYALSDNAKPHQVFTLITQLEDFFALEIIKNDSSFKHIRTSEISKNETLATDCGIIIDYNGVLHALGNPAIGPVNLDRVKYFTGQINKALEVIREISPEAYSLISTFTNMIHFRSDPKRPNYASWSTHIGIGKIVACNFEYIADSLEEVIDFLIHESIHNFLHLMEEEYGAFLEKEALEKEWIKDKTVSSPWSGVKIDLGSYTHAISVWYGLSHFWTKALDYKGELPQANIEKMKNQACKGFLKSENVHLAAGSRFIYMKKDYLAFSLNFQSKVSMSNSRGVEC